MPEAGSDQRTESPTAKRLADAVKKGDVLQSRDFSAAIVMLAGAGWLLLAGPWIWGQCLALLKAGLAITPHQISSFGPAADATTLSVLPLSALVALFGATLAATVIVPVVLGSFGFRSGALAPKANRLDPLKGLVRMFGSQGAIELAKAIAKAALLGLVGYFVLSRAFAESMAAGRSDLVTSVGIAGRNLGFALLVLTAGLMLIALVDVPVQYFQRLRRLRMTKQEVKEELRESDGAPELKQALRRRQAEILSFGGRKAMAEANVVLTNPQHFAVALRYRPGKDHAPVVVARGRDEAAQAIKALARKHRVPSLEYPQLARAIYFTSRAGQGIAEDLYFAVATILAFVMNLERGLSGGVARPLVVVPANKRFDAEGRPEH